MTHLIELKNDSTLVNSHFFRKKKGLLRCFLKQAIETATEKKFLVAVFLAVKIKKPLRRLSATTLYI